MHISFDQIIYIVGALLLAMSGAIGAMFKWILGRIDNSEKRWLECEKKHAESEKKLAKLEAAHNLADMFADFKKTVTDLLRQKEAL